MFDGKYQMDVKDHIIFAYFSFDTPSQISNIVHCDKGVHVSAWTGFTK